MRLTREATSLSTLMSQQVAEAGFYHPARTGQDYVVCFACGKSMEGWEETDCPLYVHAVPENAARIDFHAAHNGSAFL